MNDLDEIFTRAYALGTVLGALQIGLISGMVPLVTGLALKRNKVAVGGLAASVVAGLVGGLILAAPVAIGFAVAALLKPVKSASAQIQSESRPCPFCAELIKREAIVCRFCGKNINAMPALTENEPSIADLKKKMMSGENLSLEQVSALADGASIDPSIATWRSRVNGTSLLHYAARCDMKDEVQKLLNAGANPEASDGSGRKPVQLAKNEEIVRVLESAVKK